MPAAGHLAIGPDLGSGQMACCCCCTCTPHHCLRHRSSPQTAAACGICSTLHGTREPALMVLCTIPSALCACCPMRTVQQPTTLHLDLLFELLFPECSFTSTTSSVHLTLCRWECSMANRSQASIFGANLVLKFSDLTFFFRRGTSRRVSVSAQNRGWKLDATPAGQRH